MCLIQHNSIKNGYCLKTLPIIWRNVLSINGLCELEPTPLSAQATLEKCYMKSGDSRNLKLEKPHILACSRIARLQFYFNNIIIKKEHRKLRATLRPTHDEWKWAKLTFIFSFLATLISKCKNACNEYYYYYILWRVGEGESERHMA